MEGLREPARDGAGSFVSRFPRLNGAGTAAPEASRGGAGLSARTVAVGAAAGVALAALAAAIPLLNDSAPNPGYVAVLNGATVAILIGVGLFAWRRDPTSKFGPILVLAGAVSVLESFVASGHSFAYTLGTISIWLREALLIYLFISFPTGIARGRGERIVLVGTTLTLLLLYLPSALLESQFPPLPIYCGGSCPSNALQVVHPEPGFVGDILVPLRQGASGALFLAAALVVLLRLLSATPLMRRGLAPVLTVAVVRAVALVGLHAAWAFGWTPLVAPIEWVVFWTIPVAAVAFLVGLLRWQIYSLQALRELALDREEPADLNELEARLAGALGDPSLQLLSTNGNSSVFHDRLGHQVSLPSTSERCVVEIEDEGRTIAAIACDPALADQRDLVDAAAGWARAILVRRRLSQALRASVRSLEASRRRIAAAAAVERRRIERDLHDGAQQQLVTLRVKLELLGEEISQNPERGAELLKDLAPRVDSVIEEVRSLASGIYPSLLSDAGLVEALRAVARRNEVPTTLSADGVGSYPAEIESAVYFCCLEALQNADKHANPSVISIELSADTDYLGFEVRDDGDGFDVAGVERGAGLTNIRDRVATLGGGLALESTPGTGTVVRGRVQVSGAT